MATTPQIAPAVVSTDAATNSVWDWVNADVATLLSADGVIASHQTQNTENFPQYSFSDWLIFQPDLVALAAAIPAGNDPVGLEIAMENMATNSRFAPGKIRELTDNDPDGPLHHGVQISKDGGATWHNLTIDGQVYAKAPDNRDLLHGGPTDLAGVTLTRAELLSGAFRFRIMTSGVDLNSPQHMVDHVALIVHHEPAGGGGPGPVDGGDAASAASAAGGDASGPVTVDGGDAAATVTAAGGDAAVPSSGSITPGGYLSFGTNKGTVVNVDRATQVAALPISWTVDSGSDFDIEARVIAEVGGATVVDWTTIATGVTANGAATLSLPRTSDARNLVQLRVVGETAIETASGRVGAGLVWVAYGQSQIANRNSTFSQYPAPANVSLLKFADQFVATGTWVDAERATCGGIGLHVSDRPVAVIAAAVGSQSIEQLTSGVILSRMIDAINGLGGSAVIELEQMTANLGNDAATSEAAHRAFVQAVRAGCTGDVEFVFSLGSNHPAEERPSTQGVAAGKLAVIESEPDVYLGPHAYDLETSDNVHWTVASYNLSAGRAGLAAAWRTGITGERNGPQMVSASASGTTVTIVVANDPGSVLDSAIDAYAMRVFDSGGGNVAIQSAAVTGDAEITLTVAAPVIGGTVEFGYMLDGRTTYVFDDKGLPLQITTPGREIAIADGSTPVEPGGDAASDAGAAGGGASATVSVDGGDAAAGAEAGGGSAGASISVDGGDAGAGASAGDSDAQATVSVGGGDADADAGAAGGDVAVGGEIPGGESGASAGAGGGDASASASADGGDAPADADAAGGAAQADISIPDGDAAADADAAGGDAQVIDVVPGGDAASGANAAGGGAGATVSVDGGDALASASAGGGGASGPQDAPALPIADMRQAPAIWWLFEAVAEFDREGIRMRYPEFLIRAGDACEIAIPVRRGDEPFAPDQIEVLATNGVQGDDVAATVASTDDPAVFVATWPNGALDGARRWAVHARMTSGVLERTIQIATVRVEWSAFDS